MSEASPDRLLLPPDARLLHVGPHKTGTTALQSAFHHHRLALAAHGVHYAGQGQQPAEAAIAVTGGSPLRGEAHAGIDAWHRLVAELRAAGSRRVFLSSEFFANADAETAHRIARETGTTHLLVTLRPLWQITPSQWQQYVQNGNRAPFVRWLDKLLNQPPYDRPSPSFWRRHDHGALVERWAATVGPDRVTVVVVDDRDRPALMRAVEQMLGLSRGTLVPQEDRTNRSLTWPEAELVRRLNRRFVREGWSEESYAALVRRGVVRAMKAAAPYAGSSRITLPDWAHAPLEQVAHESVETIRSCGVRVVGDLSLLLSPVPDGEAGDGARIDPETVARAITGIVEASGDADPSGATRVADAPVYRIGSELLQRGTRRARIQVTEAVTGLRHRGG